MKRERLSQEEIGARLEGLKGWAVADEKLTKTFEFATYASGVMFAAAVGHMADRMDHHPDMVIGYRKVTLAVNTHDVNGISEWDFELARRADLLVG
jgi:4a-hydroxytetrahydrobiopterin dehydratase